MAIGKLNDAYSLVGLTHFLKLAMLTSVSSYAIHLSESLKRDW